METRANVGLEDALSSRSRPGRWCVWLANEASVDSGKVRRNGEPLELHEPIGQLVKHHGNAEKVC